jgi:hypothetical protein
MEQVDGMECKLIGVEHMGGGTPPDLSSPPKLQSLELLPSSRNCAKHRYR